MTEVCTVKISAEGKESDKTTLDDNAAIYSKREEKSGKEHFKDLQGEEKWQYFKDYMLLKIVVGVIIAALGAHLLYSIFGPKPETIMTLALIDNPFELDQIDKLTADLTGIMVTDEKKEEIRLDTDYYFYGDEYNARMKFMTLIAAGDIDFVVLPLKEYRSYSESETFLSLSEVIGEEKVREYSAYAVTENGVCYALDVSPVINKLLGVDTIEGYYLACIVNAKHKENMTALVDYLYGLIR